MTRKLTNGLMKSQNDLVGVKTKKLKFQDKIITNLLFAHAILDTLKHHDDINIRNDCQLYLKLLKPFDYLINENDCD